VYYDPTQTSVTPTIIAANLSQYKYMYLYGSNLAACVTTVQGLVQQGIIGKVPIIITPNCVGQSVYNALEAVHGNTLVQYYYYGPSIYEPYKPTSQVASFIQAARDTSNIVNINADPSGTPLATGEVLYLAKAFDELGYSKLTLPNIEAQLPKVTGGEFMGPAAEKFNYYTGLANVGSVGFYLYNFEGQAKNKNPILKPVDGGKYFSVTP